MKKTLLTWLFMLPLVAVVDFAAAAGGNEGVTLDRVEVSLSDKVSLQNGAKLFVNYCVSCHSAKYMRYNRMAEDLEIPQELVEEQMIFTGGKIGDQMTATMAKKDGDAWFGVAPPDLTLIGKLRDPEWLYTYLRTFYRDESTPSGWNNAVFPNVAMPHVLSDLQGIQRPIYKVEMDTKGNERDVLRGFKLEREGRMTAEEFDHAMRDLTNFLYYMAEPARMDRIGWGMWVLLFLAAFGFLAYLLKKEYWRDVH